MAIDGGTIMTTNPAKDVVVVTPPPLSGRDRSSFAYPALKDRVPVIICKIIDRLYRERGQRDPRDRDQIKVSIEAMVMTIAIMIIITLIIWF